MEYREQKILEELNINLVDGIKGGLLHYGP